MNGVKKSCIDCLEGKEIILKEIGSIVAETEAQPSQLKKGEQFPQSSSPF